MKDPRSRPRLRIPPVDYNRPDWPQQLRQAEKARKAGKKESLRKWKDVHGYQAKRIWRTYSMSLDQVTAMHNAQEGKCANPGCRAPIKVFGRSRAIDHCHKTGKVRGMLCKACNLGLGLFDDNPRKLVGILAYLGFIDRNLLPPT